MPDDNKYSCAQLKVGTSVLQENVGFMDKSIGIHSEQAQSHATTASVAPVIGASPAITAGLQMMSASDSKKAGELQQIRDSQQLRHDHLMELYQQKNCDD